MSSQRKVYTRDFKQEALRLAETSSKSMTALEADLGLPSGLLSKWKRQQAAEGQEAFRGQGRLTSSEAELHQLRQENEVLRQEREILKKALAIFTRSQR